MDSDERLFKRYPTMRPTEPKPAEASAEAQAQSDFAQRRRAADRSSKEAARAARAARNRPPPLSNYWALLLGRGR